MNAKTVGENIKNRRLSLFKTVEEVCERAGVSRSTWYRYESGKIENISTKTMAGIARVLQTSASELLGYDVNTGDNPGQTNTNTDVHLTLNERDIDAIAERVHSYSSPESAAPRTIEARIVSFGMDRLPHEDRERLLAMIRAMYANRPELFENRKGENNER